MYIPEVIASVQPLAQLAVSVLYARYKHARSHSSERWRTARQRASGLGFSFHMFMARYFCVHGDMRAPGLGDFATPAARPKKFLHFWMPLLARAALGNTMLHTAGFVKNAYLYFVQLCECGVS